MDAVTTALIVSGVLFCLVMAIAIEVHRHRVKKSRGQGYWPGKPIDFPPLSPMYTNKEGEVISDCLKRAATIRHRWANTFRTWAPTSDHADDWSTVVSVLFDVWRQIDTIKDPTFWLTLNDENTPTIRHLFEHLNRKCPPKK